jgi:hypothetical protein
MRKKHPGEGAPRRAQDAGDRILSLWTLRHLAGQDPALTLRSVPSRVGVRRKVDLERFVEGLRNAGLPE